MTTITSSSFSSCHALIAQWSFHLHVEESHLRTSDELVVLFRSSGRGRWDADGHKSRTDEIFTLEVDLEPFNASFPHLSLSSSIGDGVKFLNRNLSSRLLTQTGTIHP